LKLSQSAWTIDDAVTEYGIDRWGDGYFSISDQGTVLVTPDGDPNSAIELKALVNDLVDRGLKLPILIRFNGILRNRLRRLNDCFAAAIADHGYQNRYRCVFPIKVNQQREVVQQIVDAGSEFGFGIEAGSKAELLAAIAMSMSPTADGGNASRGREAPIICNGFKDEEFIRLAMLTHRLGRNVLPVIEKVSELDLILRIAADVGVRPKFGMRVKLATRGSGRWQASGGYRSKFGLTVAEMLAQLDRLIDLGMADCFQLLHFHVGSQIGNIRQLKSAILEASRIYVDLRRRGAALGYLDVGGGLGVDYDGSNSDTSSSMNYSVQEYANDVVFHVQSVCDEAGVPHPQLISESGRAVAAQHSVLVVETLGVTRQGATQLPDWAQPSPPPRSRASIGPPDHYEQPVHDLWATYCDLTPANKMESFHDAQVSLDLCMNLFSGGYLPLEQRVAAENLYFALCHRVRELADNELAAGESLPDELRHLDRMLSDIYFVNFSLFQSMPDSWAVDQLFPIMPIDRLGEIPTRDAVLGDLTCDSDGKVDRFVSGKGNRATLPLHSPIEGQSYRLAVFLVGAYQETLGDLHNLFGDTHAVHVESDRGITKADSVVRGDTVSQVLGYVQYTDQLLLDRIKTSVDDAIGHGRIDEHQAHQTMATFRDTLAGYTYLQPVHQSSTAVTEGADKSILEIAVTHPE